MQFSVFQDSLIGGRRYNQDRMGYRFTHDCVLLVLADGMGGHMRGEEAATIAVQTLAKAFDVQAKPYIRKPEVFLRESFLAAHQGIHRYRAMHNLPDSPRTTIVACVIQHGQAYWAHCGDSRLYLIRHGGVAARTRDHSHIEQLIAEGRALESERDTHPERNTLYNCLGAGTLPDVECAPPMALEQGDSMLLCSDGLWGVMPERDLVAGMLSGSLDQALPALLKRAVVLGGDTGDNCTGLALRWEGDEAAAGDDCATTVIAGDMPTLLVEGFGPRQVGADPSSFAEEFAATFGTPLSATIMPAAQNEAAPLDLDQAVADVQAAIRSAPTKKT